MKTVTEILLDVSRIMSSSLDLDIVSGLILKESAKALGADHASLFLTDDVSGHLILTKAKGFSPDQLDNIKLLGSWEVITTQLVKKKKSLVVNDVAGDAIFRNRKLPFFRESLPIKSFLAVPLKKDSTVIGALIVSNKKKPGRLFTKEDEKLLAALSNHIAIALLNAKLYQRLDGLFISTVRSLTRAVDAKDRYTSGHSERVMKYTLALGKELNLDEGLLENLKLSSLLHDVGKIGVKESILAKPARLLGYERSQINRHPAIGADIVKGIDNSDKIIRGILEHHEHFDGKGYPNRLKGDAISLEGRIIAVGDTYDALTTDRPYHRRYSSKEAYFEIKRSSSKQFDPKVVRAFISSFSKHPQSWET